jgi:DNA polymerase/3'-5' exonuclease PolX
MTPPEKIRFPRALALDAASVLVAHLTPHCLRIIVAGSLRRERPDVGDIEIVFIPHRMKAPDPNDLFNVLEVDCAAVMINAMVSAGFLVKRAKSDGTFTWGEQIKLAVHTPNGIPVDFFTATETNWWNLLVCRTGSADSNVAICNAAIARGLKWQPYGAGFEDRVTGEIVHVSTSEEDVFAAVGLPCLPPHQR